MYEQGQITVSILVTFLQKLSFKLKLISFILFYKQIYIYICISWNVLRCIKHKSIIWSIKWILNCTYEDGRKMYLRKTGDMQSYWYFSKICLSVQCCFFSSFPFASQNTGHLSLRSLFSHFRSTASPMANWTRTRQVFLDSSDRKNASESSTSVARVVWRAGSSWWSKVNARSLTAALVQNMPVLLKLRSVGACASM